MTIKSDGCSNDYCYNGWGMKQYYNSWGIIYSMQGVVRYGRNMILPLLLLGAPAARTWLMNA